MDKPEQADRSKLWIAFAGAGGALLGMEASMRKSKSKG